MLDGHPRSHKLHGVRDFLLHLFTITIGLLIALGLEAAVERYNHHKLAQESEAGAASRRLETSASPDTPL